MESLPAPSLGEQSSADLQLTVGALIVEEMRTAVEKHTGFRCSAGISHNKVGQTSRDHNIMSSDSDLCRDNSLRFAFQGIGQTSLWSEQTQQTNYSAFGLGGRTF